MTTAAIMSLAGAEVRPHPAGGWTLALPVSSGARLYAGAWATAAAARAWLDKARAKAREVRR